MRSFWRTTRSNHSPPRGVTLLELLVVMTILLMVTAAAIPMILPATQNRRMRESARLVSSFISGARSRAIESGRPVGVMFERFNGLPFSMNLSYVEVPPPYSGDTLDSKILVASNGKITGFVTGDLLWMNVIRYGDLVKLDFKGPSYILASQTALPDPNAGQVIPGPPSATVNWYLVPSVGGTAILPISYSTNPGVPFQIFRQPVRSSAAPMQLPEGVVIDLVSSSMNFSGPIGSLNATFPPDSPYPLAAPRVSFNPLFTFAPSGRLDFCTDNALGSMTRSSAPIYLLLGRRDLMYDIVTNGTNNDLVDRNLSEPPTAAPALMPPPPNFWVAVGNTTGLVTVTEVAPNCQNINPIGIQTYAGLLQQALQQARAFAQQAQSLGGR